MQLITFAVTFKILPCTLPSVDLDAQMQKVLPTTTIVGGVLHGEFQNWYLSEYV